VRVGCGAVGALVACIQDTSMPVCESLGGAVVGGGRLRRLYSSGSWCFLDARHVGMWYRVGSRVMLRAARATACA
jgi:hypothetical protein